MNLRPIIILTIDKLKLMPHFIFHRVLVRKIQFRRKFDNSSQTLVINQLKNVADKFQQTERGICVESY